MKNKSYLYVKALSDLGTRMDMIVLGVLIYAATNSVGWLSASLAVGVLGGMLSSLFSGVVADRYDRKKVMIVTDIVRFGLLILLIPFPSPEMILVVRFLSGMFATFFEVSYNAEIPQIYGNGNLLTVNALISRLGAICMVFGFLGGGLLQDALGYEIVIALDASSYLVSAFALTRMKWRLYSPSPASQLDTSTAAPLDPSSAQESVHPQTRKNLLCQQLSDLRRSKLTYRRSPRCSSSSWCYCSILSARARTTSACRFWRSGSTRRGRRSTTA